MRWFQYYSVLRCFGDRIRCAMDLNVSDLKTACVGCEIESRHLPLHLSVWKLSPHVSKYYKIIMYSCKYVGTPGCIVHVDGDTYLLPYTVLSVSIPLTETQWVVDKFWVSQLCPMCWLHRGRPPSCLVASGMEEETRARAL